MKATEAITNPDREPDESVRTISERRPGSGILVFTSCLQLLHRNSQALALSRRIMEAETGTGARDVFPRVVTELCDEIKRGLQIRIDAGNCAQFQVRRLSGDAPEAVVLHGIGLPDRGGLQESRILIVMVETGR